MIDGKFSHTIERSAFNLKMANSECGKDKCCLVVICRKAIKLLMDYCVKMIDCLGFLVTEVFFFTSDVINYFHWIGITMLMEKKKQCKIAIFLTSAVIENLRNRCDNCRPEAKTRSTTHRMRKIPLTARVWNKILCTEAILQIHK